MIDRPQVRPGYDREFVGEPFDLPPPRRRAVPHVAMEEDERGSSAGPFVGNAEPVNLDHFHGALRGEVRPVDSHRRSMQGEGTLSHLAPAL
jgi:hypothetical protein